MPPTDRFWVKGDRTAQVDWSDSKLTDEALQRKAAEVLPKLFERMQTDDGTAECAVIISGNLLQGSEALASTLLMFRKNHVRISTLRLHKNKLGDEAMQALVEHIENAALDGQALMELHLSNNQITEVGIRNLVQAAHRTGVYCGKREKRPDGREDRRYAALWLRVENQSPAFTDAGGVLERLESEGCPVCLLPSKDWKPPAEKKGNWPKLEAAVHMHHSFVRRDRKGGEDWEEREGKTNDKTKGGKAKEWTEERQDWSSGAPEKSKAKGSGGNKKGAAEEWRSSKDDNGKNGKATGKGKGQDAKGYPAMGWRNAWHDERRGQEGVWWKGGWGHDESWNEWDDEEEDDRARDAYRSRQRGDAWRDREDRYHEHEPGQRDGRDRWEEDWDDELDSPERQDRGYDRMADEVGRPSPSRPFGEPQQWEEEPQDSMGYQNSAQMQPPGEAMGSPWLDSAAASVLKKIQDCERLDMLNRSLNPTSVSEHEWLQLAEIGAQAIARNCTQRSSVVVGSFVDMEGLQELHYACAGQVGLAAVFRHLQLHRLLPPGPLQDDQDERRCASIVAALYGELINVPPEGDNHSRENARAVAEWAFLDFVFLLGFTRLSFGFSSNPGDLYQSGMTDDGY